MTKRTTKIDFSEVENIRFTCIEQCGKCCFYQAPVLRSTEINRILSFLETKSSEEFDRFVFDWAIYLGMSDLDEETVQAYKESLKFFWSPFQLEETDEGILVYSYTVHFMPSSGRCKLLNPIDYTCFIHPVRPATCRIYPFTHKFDRTGIAKIVVAMENCPGLGIGSPLDREEIEEIIEKAFVETKKDIEAYKKYIHEKGIKTIKRKHKAKEIRDIDKALMDLEKSWREQYFFGKKSELNAEGKKYIEPLAELGLIPPHPLLILWNNSLIKRKHPS